MAKKWKVIRSDTLNIRPKKRDEIPIIQSENRKHRLNEEVKQCFSIEDFLRSGFTGASALLKSGTPEIKAFIQALRKKYISLEKGSVVEFLAKIGTPALEAIFKTSDTNDFVWKSILVQVAKKIGHPAINLLVRELKNNMSQETRFYIARALVEIGDSAIEPLVQTLEQGDRALKTVIVEVIYKFGDTARKEFVEIMEKYKDLYLAGGFGGTDDWRIELR